ncbi:MAG: dTDP-4-dehydrorhamnose reductase [Alloprevotella sp.]|nr:dTDP-4-dehydrorhamnose reductase [Alloprevotella sp.]
MNILVTGANGQLGSELRRLVKEGAGVPDEFIFTDVEELDITDAEAVRHCVAEKRVGLIINCAAFTAVDKAESEPELCDLLNHRAPRLLAETMAEVGGQLLHISTDYVFDGTAHRPYTEDAPTCPNSVYGRTKLLGEEALMEACPNSVIVRTAWLYSSYGNNFVKTMLRLGRERESLGVVADQIGTPTYARDLASALLQMVRHGLVPGIYHYSNEGVTSWYDFTREIHRQAGITSCRVSPLHTEDYPAPAPRPHFSVLDKTKIKATYGITIPWWADSLRNCLNELELQARDNK